MRSLAAAALLMTEVDARTLVAVGMLLAVTALYSHGTSKGAAPEAHSTANAALEGHKVQCRGAEAGWARVRNARGQRRARRSRREAMAGRGWPGIPGGLPAACFWFLVGFTLALALGVGMCGPVVSVWREVEAGVLRVPRARGLAAAREVGVKRRRATTRRARARRDRVGKLVSRRRFHRSE